MKHTPARLVVYIFISLVMIGVGFCWGATDAKERIELEQIMPTPDSPVSDQDYKSLLQEEMKRIWNTPPDQMKAHRTAVACFGEVPGDAERVEREISINPGRARWHSTGLYAAPGEAITIILPPTLDPEKRPWMRINSNTDNISRKKHWKRLPKVSNTFHLQNATNVVANPFGGLIFIDLGRNPPKDIGTYSVTIRNAVEAPYFVLGKTSDEEWRESIRNNPAPYAELVSKHLCITLPSKHIRELDNPTELMEFLQ